MTQKINTYFAVLIITLLGSAAALTIIRVANNTTYNVEFVGNGFSGETFQHVTATPHKS